LLEGNITVDTKGEAMNTFSVSHGLSIDGKVSNCRRLVGILAIVQWLKSAVNAW